MKEVIEKQEYLDWLCGHCTEKKYCMIEKCNEYKIINAAPFKKVPYMAFAWDGWHDANEQLPPECNHDTGYSDPVLVTMTDDKGHSTTEISECYVSEKRWLIPEHIKDDYHVTAWMELPEPYYDPRSEVKELADKIGIHKLYAIVKEMRGD